MLNRTPWSTAVPGVATILLLLLASCASQAPTEPPPPAVNSSEAGKLYQANCSACHGPDRMGSQNVAPALFLYGVKDEAIHTTIAKGVPQTAMPGFEDRLKPEEIDALVKFLKTPPAGN